MADDNKVLSDEDLKNVSGGVLSASRLTSCSSYRTQRDCMTNNTCIWVDGACVVGKATRSI